MLQPQRRTRQRNTCSFRTLDQSVVARCAMMHAIVLYSARLALFIHGITYAKKIREVWPAIFVKESS
jgi:hypothetical protein